MKIGKRNANPDSNSSPTSTPTSTPEPPPTPVTTAEVVSDIDDFDEDDDLADLEPGPEPPVKFRPYTLVDKQEADRIARNAVETVLTRQADAARYDVVEGNRVVLTLDDETLRSYRGDWETHNATLPANTRINFSEYITQRLKACRTHTAVRPVYVRDRVRQEIEALFSEMVVTDEDLLNKIDRHIRPIVESAEGELRIKPLDPSLIEMVSGWEPDKTPAEAIGDFMVEAAMARAGLA